jgi:hypothetical protein
MEVVMKYALDRVEVEQTWKTINVRSRVQKWVKNGADEMLVEPNAGLHRVVLNPGDWAGADKWGVRSYADIAWGADVISAWQAEQERIRALTAARVQAPAADTQADVSVVPS